MPTALGGHESRALSHAHPGLWAWHPESSHLSFEPVKSRPKRLALIDLDLPPAKLPKRVIKLLDDADLRIERFVHDHRDSPIAAFVPCDFVLVYQALAQIAELNLAAGHRFIEWGSGVGVATCLAAMQGFDAIGVEIEPDLVEVSTALAADHEVEAEFVAASFIPEGGEELVDEQRDINWLRTDDHSAYDLIDLEPDDFDLVFSYPWPGEEEMVYKLFAEYAAVGALLLTYHGQDGVLLRRKVR
jgi:hypothetical protein